jgi:hypothetical protein
MVDDTIPEEREDAYQPLIALLRRDQRALLALTSTERTQIIDRARERLARRGATASALDETLIERSAHDAQPVGLSARRSLPVRFLRDVAAVLLAVALVGATLLIFNSAARQKAGPPSTATSGPIAQTEADGLRASLHIVTPGPYFLRELIAIDLSLTNQTGHSVRIAGGSKPDSVCSSSALSVQIHGGPPHDALPRLVIGCLDPLYVTTLAPGQTLSMRYYLPVTAGSAVTVAMGGMGGIHQGGPLDGHWPAISIQVAPQPPADRIITLQDQGARVIVQAPPAALAHLLYRESFTCDQGLMETTAEWTPLAAPALSQPDCLVAATSCPRISAEPLLSGTPLPSPIACPAKNVHWLYMVSAPGYAITSGSRNT